MSDTTTPPAAPVDPTPVAPVVEAPVVAPVVETPPAPAPAVESPTLLGEAPPPVAPVEAAPPEPDKVEGQSVEPAPPPTYEAFALPEGVTLEPERIAEFTDLLGNFEGQTKADHAAVQAFGQQLLDKHVSMVQQAVQTTARLLAQQRDAEVLGWKDAFLSDPEIGGNRVDTTVEAARQFIRTNGGTDEQQAELRQLMDKTGVGNHPALIRLLAKANLVAAEGRPLAAQAPAPQARSKVQKMYGGTAN